MKTISMTRSRGSAFSAIAVLGSLAALYFYRRRGGEVSSLVRPALDKVSQARNFLRRTSPSVSSSDTQSVNSSVGIESAIPTT